MECLAVIHQVTIKVIKHACVVTCVVLNANVLSVLVSYIKAMIPQSIGVAFSYNFPSSILPFFLCQRCS